MKLRKSLLFAVATGALLCAGSVMAQDTAPSTTPAMTAAPTHTAVYATPQGELTVNSTAAPAPTIAPAPAFAQLSGGGKAITEQQANAYPPLANDFIHADTNQNGSISKTEYEHWTKQL
ncbi:MAG: hypothetical protein ABI114_06850 [Rhodanobacter sp.]